MTELSTILWGIPAIAAFALLMLLVRSQARIAAVVKTGWTRILAGAVSFLVFCLVLFFLHLPVAQMLLGAKSDWIAVGAFILFAAGLLLAIPAAVNWLSDMAQMRAETEKRMSAVSLTEDLLQLAGQSGPLTELLTAGLKTMADYASAKAGMVWLVARDRTTLILAGAHGFDKPAMKAAETIVATGHELFDRALQGHQPVAAGDLSSRTRFLQAFPGMEAFQSVAVVPLSGGGDTIGMILVASPEPYHFTPVLLRALGGAGRVLGSAVHGQRLQRELQKFEREAADKSLSLVQWEQSLGGRVPVTIHTVLHGLKDALKARAAFLVPSRARYVPYSSDGSLLGLPMDGVWSEAIAKAEEKGRALWVNPGHAGTDPRNAHGRWIVVPTPAGCIFFSPDPSNVAFSNDDLARIARIAEVGLLLAPPPDRPEPEVILGAAARLAEEPGSPQVFAEVVGELVPNAEAVLVWQKHEGRLTIVGGQGCSIEPLSKVNLPLGQGTVGKAALSLQSLSIESNSELGRSWAEYSARERKAFADAFGGLERPAAEYLAPIPHADLVLQIVRFTRGGWPESTVQMVAELVRAYGVRPPVEARPSIPMPTELNEAANDLNNLLTGILGQAELLSRRLAEAGVPDAERDALERIISAAQSGGELVARMVSPGSPVQEGGLDKLAAQLLSGRHITDDLYLLPENRAVQIQTSFEATPQLDSDRADTSRLQNLLWSSLSIVAKGRNSVALSTSADDRYIYLAVGDRENREPLKGPFGDYFRAPDVHWSALLPQPDLDYLRSAGAQIASDSDREPRRLVLRFPFGPAPGTGKPQHPGLRVLAIDDQEIIRDLLLNMFMGMGHRIKVCKSGEEGIEALKSEQFDLVLTDLGMPGMSGWEVAQAVKERNPETPVVLITGWGFNFAEEQVRKAGVDYVLTKPFRLEHLTEVVETAIRRSPQVL